MIQCGAVGGEQFHELVDCFLCWHSSHRHYEATLRDPCREVNGMLEWGRSTIKDKRNAHSSADRQEWALCWLRYYHNQDTVCVFLHLKCY